MKKILALILCVVLLGATCIIASAEDGSAEVVETETSVTETEAEKPITDVIVDYIKSNLEELCVLVGLALGAFYSSISNKKIIGSAGTLNNNAIAIAENSAATMNKALEGVNNSANAVIGFNDKIEELLAEVRKSAEEKQSLETFLAHIETFLKATKLATLELSNEVAELLVLANIPNSKKEELYSRHSKAVHELEVIEEVMSSDGTKA